MRTTLLFALLLCSGCFGLVTKDLQCSGDGVCGEGRRCLDGLCVAGALQDGAPAAGDAGADQQAAQPGCSGPGEVRLGPKAAACPGLFSAGGAAGRCAAGWSPCKSAAGVDLDLCNNSPQLKGFFVADAPGTWTNNYMAPLCRTTLGNQEREMFFGCGRTGAYTFTADNPCNGFARSLECITVNSKWMCFVQDRPHTLADASNANADDGVLCCAN